MQDQKKTKPTPHSVPAPDTQKNDSIQFTKELPTITLSIPNAAFNTKVEVAINETEIFPEPTFKQQAEAPEQTLKCRIRLIPQGKKRPREKMKYLVKYKEWSTYEKKWLIRGALQQYPEMLQQLYTQQIL